MSSTRPQLSVVDAGDSVVVNAAPSVAMIQEAPLSSVSSVASRVVLQGNLTFVETPGSPLLSSVEETATQTCPASPPATGSLTSVVNLKAPLFLV